MHFALFFSALHSIASDTGMQPSPLNILMMYWLLYKPVKMIKWLWFDSDLLPSFLRQLAIHTEKCNVQVFVFKHSSSHSHLQPLSLVYTHTHTKASPGEGDLKWIGTVPSSPVAKQSYFPYKLQFVKWIQYVQHSRRELCWHTSMALTWAADTKRLSDSFCNQTQVTHNVSIPKGRNPLKWNNGSAR